ncbi:hypothetical protein D046_7668B, partial [Vibrio parahaemolyticus V-223/04]
SLCAKKCSISVSTIGDLRWLSKSTFSEMISKATTS